MARPTQNPKLVGGAILFSLGLGVYLHGPDFWRQITAPPPKPLVPPAMPQEGSDDVKFYRLVPGKLPDKWEQILADTNEPATVFDEVPKTDRTKKEEVLPDLTPGWHLSSIYISPEERVAVVSGTVVREGDFLGPFTVQKIEEGQVTFRHPMGERQMLVGQIIPATNSVSPKPPPGKSPKGAVPGGTNPPLEDANVLLKALEGLDQWRENKLQGGATKPVSP